MNSVAAGAEEPPSTPHQSEAAPAPGWAGWWRLDHDSVLLLRLTARAMKRWWRWFGFFALLTYVVGQVSAALVMYFSTAQYGSLLLTFVYPITSVLEVLPLTIWFLAYQAAARCTSVVLNDSAAPAYAFGAWPRFVLALIQGVPILVTSVILSPIISMLWSGISLGTSVTTFSMQLSLSPTHMLLKTGVFLCGIIAMEDKRGRWVWLLYAMWPVLSGLISMIPVDSPTVDGYQWGEPVGVFLGLTLTVVALIAASRQNGRLAFGLSAAVYLAVLPGYLLAIPAITWLLGENVAANLFNVLDGTESWAGSLQASIGFLTISMRPGTGVSIWPFYIHQLPVPNWFVLPVLAYNLVLCWLWYLLVRLFVRRADSRTD